MNRLSSFHFLCWLNQLNAEKNRIVIRARAVAHHKCPEVQNVVRVKQYQSQLVLIPHTTFNEVVSDMMSYSIMGTRRLQAVKETVALKMFCVVGRTRRDQNENIRLTFFWLWSIFGSVASWLPMSVLGAWEQSWVEQTCSEGPNQSRD